jgi:hypothetical protein
LYTGMFGIPPVDTRLPATYRELGPVDVRYRLPVSVAPVSYEGGSNTGYRLPV